MAQIIWECECSVRRHNSDERECTPGRLAERWRAALLSHVQWNKSGLSGEPGESPKTSHEAPRKTASGALARQMQSLRDSELAARILMTVVRNTAVLPPEPVTQGPHFRLNASILSGPKAARIPTTQLRYNYLPSLRKRQSHRWRVPFGLAYTSLHRCYLCNAINIYAHSARETQESWCYCGGHLRDSAVSSCLRRQQGASPGSVDWADYVRDPAIYSLKWPHNIPKCNNVRFHKLPSETQCLAVGGRAIERNGHDGMSTQSAGSWLELPQVKVLRRGLDTGASRRMQASAGIASTAAVLL
ncbi:hypothetical protein HPB51_028764 [Rhipicephalus microplus]|uniref:Uncharacterized protein n=1 Tax=Rhipicephalus microplus TaxID=6941 RepID=A0A9J6CWE2_RHIMP|nr:hypothetical protein HPB51_028764 [Rhipicephalus microplus]